MMYYGLLQISLFIGSCALPKGREFVAAFPETYYQGFFPEISFVILSDVNTTVHIESKGFNISEDVDVQAMVEHRYSADSLFYYKANLEVTDMTFSVSSGTDITLFCYNAMIHRGDGYVALPIIDLATQYIVVTQIDNHTSNIADINLPYTGQSHTVLLIVATQDATQVDVSLNINGPLMAGGCGGGTFFNGETRTFTLNKYQIVGAYCTEDITGTLVTSDKPVAVLSGHNTKRFSGSSNLLLEMLLPVKSFGRSFVLPEPPTITGGAVYRVVGSEATTTVRSPSGMSFSLGEGEYLDIDVNSTTGSLYIEADRPVSVVQFTQKLASMAIVPPTSLFAGDYDISKPVFNPTYDLHSGYLTVIVPTDKVIGLRPQIFPQFTVIKGSCFSVASVELRTGFYRLLHVDGVPFGGMMYLKPHWGNIGIFTHPIGYNLTDDTVKLGCSSSGICSDGTPYPCSCSEGYFVYQCDDSSAGCNNDPCHYNSSCEDLGSTYICDCVNGSGGAHCEIDIYNHCENNTCVNGTCVDEIGAFTCNCTDGFTGENCETNINECAHGPCVHGTCMDGINNYTCICEPGYTDLDCSTDIDDCATEPCQNSGICHDFVNYFNCSCTPGFIGLLCETDMDECSSNPCVNGTCSDQPNMYKCTCTPGYEGVNCDEEINECATSLCVHGTCVDHVNNYTCICEPGYTDWNCSTDIDECATNPCVNGACVDHVNNYTCDCEPGYTDWNCSTEINECATSLCVHGTCVDHVNNYTCICEPGYTDWNCSTDIDECATNPCVHGTCVDHVNNYTCDCEPGYTDRNCSTDIDECATNPCVSGTCVDHVNNYTCDCEPGYTDWNCSTDIDECFSNPCVNGNCSDLLNMYDCTCAPGYGGINCDTDIDDCLNGPCRNGGTCNDFTNSYNCSCVPGFEGTNCETAIDACAGNPCQNSGTCTQSSGGFTCSCPVGFMGDTCQTDIDDCASNPCQNEGTCTDRINAFECLCPANFSGLLCDILMSCTCTCRLNSSIDRNELAAKIKWLKALLTVDKSKLSSALRKKISVPDERPSATGIGFSGICCLVAAFGFFLIMDCINVIQFLTRQKDPEKKLNVK